MRAIRRSLAILAVVSAVLAGATPVSAADIVSVTALTTGGVISVAFDRSTGAGATWTPTATYVPRVHLTCPHRTFRPAQADGSRL